MVKFQNICSDVFFKSTFSTIGIPEIETIEVPSMLTSDISCLNMVESIISTESCDLFSSPGLSTSVSLHPSLSRLRDSLLTSRKKILKQRLTMLGNEFSAKMA